MNLVVPFLVLLHCLTFPYNCYGIHCKTGTYNTMGGYGYIAPAACSKEKQFCYGVICSNENWEQLDWGCSAHNSCDELSAEIEKILPLRRQQSRRAAFSPQTCVSFAVLLKL
uniref:Secreted protein n=1 Tax=Globodera pallida TaxID=36090 RepID=A0A183BNB7_GLOPA